MALQEEMELQGNWLFKYRSYLPLSVFIIGTVLYLRTEIYPVTFFLEETPYEIYYEMFALGISLFGLFIRVYTVGHTPKNTSGRNTKSGQIADTLNTSGIYSVVRHPLYLGNFFMWLGIAMLSGHAWFIIIFVLMFWIYYERIMYSEEQFLRKKFGEPYLEWSKDVPAFIPKFGNFKKPALPFSWKKVLKNERTGLFELFLVFCLYDVTGELIGKANNFNYFLIVMTLLTGVGYFVLRYLSKKTDILNEKNR
ncbi:MAG: isoprenylcysteine carboxylmethyltransferase family protein [Mariniphaga sp.]|nr:isoprenylcysteine carboxylmethyltransferase family protein [Mariniphaga sp.]